MAEDEIDSVREYYKKREEQKDGEGEKEEIAPETEERDEDPDKESADKISYQDGIRLYSEVHPPKDEEIVVIPPQDFGGSQFALTFTLYTDGVLCDEMDEVISPEEADEMLGVGWASQMGAFRPDTVHIRNPKRKTDYEIVADPESHKETHPECYQNEEDEN